MSAPMLHFQSHTSLAPSSSNSLTNSDFPTLPFLPAFFPQHAHSKDQHAMDNGSAGLGGLRGELDDFTVGAEQLRAAFLTSTPINTNLQDDSPLYSSANISMVNPSPDSSSNSEDSDSPSSLSMSASSSSSVSPLPTPCPLSSSSSKYSSSAMQAIPISSGSSCRTKSRVSKNKSDECLDNPPPLSDRKRRHRWTDHERRKRERREIQELRDALKQIHASEAQIIAETHIFPPPSADMDDDDEDDDEDDDMDDDGEESGDSASSGQQRNGRAKGKRAKTIGGKPAKRERKHHGKIVILERTANAIHVLQRRLSELTSGANIVEEKSPVTALSEELEQLQREIEVADKFLGAQRDMYASSVLSSSFMLHFPFHAGMVSVRGGLLDFNSAMSKESGWGYFMDGLRGKIYNETGLLLGVANYCAAHICGEPYEGSDPMDLPREVIAQKGPFWRMSKKRFETYLAVLEAFSRMDLQAFLPILLFAINNLKFPEIPLVIPPASDPKNDPYAEPPYYCLSDLLPYFYATHPATFRYSLPGLAKFASLFRGDVPSIEVACCGAGPGGDVFWSTTLTVFAMFDECLDELSGLPCRRPVACGLVRFTNDGRYLGNLKKIIPKRFYWSKWSLVESVQHGFELDVRTFDLGKALDEKDKIILPPEKGVKVDLADRDYSYLNNVSKQTKCNSLAAAARDPITPAHLSPISNTPSPAHEPQVAKLESGTNSAVPPLQSLPSLPNSILSPFYSTSSWSNSSSSSSVSSSVTNSVLPCAETYPAPAPAPNANPLADLPPSFVAARIFADTFPPAAIALLSPKIQPPPTLSREVNSWTSSSAATAAANARNSLTDSAVNAAYSPEFGRMFDLGSMQITNSEQLREYPMNLPFVYR